jgi:hypothetical protein
LESETKWTIVAVSEWLGWRSTGVPTLETHGFECPRRRQLASSKRLKAVSGKDEALDKKPAQKQFLSTVFVFARLTHKSTCLTLKRNTELQPIWALTSMPLYGGRTRV